MVEPAETELVIEAGLRDEAPTDAEDAAGAHPTAERAEQIWPPTW